MGHPYEVPTLPNGVSVPDYYSQIDALTDADGTPTDEITPDETSVTVSGITDAGPDTDSTIVALLQNYDVGGTGLPETTEVDATSNAVTATDLHETDGNGKEVYSWSVTLPTTGLAPGLYALHSYVYTDGVQEANGVPSLIHVYEPDNDTVTVQEAVPFTYTVHEDTEIVSVGAAQTDSPVLLPNANGSVQLSTDGRYVVWTSGDVYEEDLQTGATTDLTATGGTPPALQTTLSPKLIPVIGSDPYGPLLNGGYDDVIYPKFTENGITFSSIPSFDFDAANGGQNPLATVTDANGTEVLSPFGTTHTMVGYAAAASDNGNAVLTVQPYDVFYFAPAGSNGLDASPQYDVTYRSPAPTLTIDPVNGINQFSPGATSVTLTGTSNAIGQTVEIDFGQAGAEVGTATVQVNGKWSYNFNASAITGSSLFIEASVMSVLGTPAEVSETAQINALPVPTVTQIFGNEEDEEGRILGPGATLDIYVSTSAAVYVTGTPTLTLSNGEAATYSSGSQQLLFTYVPAIHDAGSSDLGVTGLNLPGGAEIADAAGISLDGPFTQLLDVALQTVPVIVGLDPSGSSDFVTNSATAGILVSAQSGETVILYDNGTAVGIGTVSGVGAELEVNEVEITPTMALPEGQSTLTASATDSTGRSSALSAGTTITVDTVPPAEKIASLAVNGNDDVTLAAQAGLAITITGQLSAALAPDESLILVLPNGETETVTPAGGATSFTFTPSPTEAATFGAGGTVSAYVTNAAGNVGTVANQSFTADSLRVITRISADAADPSQASGSAPSLSADGTTVAFEAEPEDESDDALRADDPGSSGGAITGGVYVADLSTGAVTLAAAGTEDAALSGDGTTLAYDMEGSSGLQVYVQDLATGSVTLVSASGGVGANDSSFEPSISADGTTVAFLSYASDLVAPFGANGNQEQLYVATLSAGTVAGLAAVSVAVDGTAGNGSTSTSALSGDGSEVAFSSEATNLLAAGDPHTPNLSTSTGQIYVRALADNAASGLSAGEIVLVSGTVDGTVGNATSDGATLSENGRYVVFTSRATDLAPDNLKAGATLPTGEEQVYVKDLLTGAISLVSQTAAGVVGDGDALDASISSDGNTVVFSDGSDNFGAGAVGEQLYAATLSNGAVTGLALLSEPGAIPGDDVSDSASVSADGTKVVFESKADNLVAGIGSGVHVYETTIAPSVSKPTVDVFSETQATGGEYFWSTAANWSAGVPVAGSAVVMAAEGVDDIAGLTLASLDLSSPSPGIDGDLSVNAGLTIGKLTIAAASRIDVISSGQPDTLTITGSIAGPQSPSVLPTLDAEGAGAVIEDMEATTPTVQYIAQDGAEVELAGALGAGTVLTFDGGTVSLAAPGATIAAKLADIGTGDVLELPGTSVSAVTFGATSLTVTTDAGTYNFTNVTYAQGSVASYSVRHDNSTGLQAIGFTAPDVFTETQATGGQYLWSTAANWSDGVPVAGGAVVMAAEGVDDIAGLTLASLDLSSPSPGIDGDLFVEAGLTIAKLTIAAASRIDVISSGQPDTLTITSSIAAPQSPSVLPTFDAEGAGAVIDDMEPTTPTVEYIAQDGAKVELAGAVSAGTVLTFDDGTFALAAPGAAVNAKLADIGTGDVLELPGTSVSAVTFGTASLTVATNSGTFDFTNVTYDQGGVVSYSASHDTSTGLEAIDFTGPDMFSETQATGGEYLWSTAANWSAGVPVAGSAVVMAAEGVDDIAGLTLASLDLSSPSPGIDGDLSVEAGLTVGALTIAAASRIDVISSGRFDSLTITGSIAAPQSPAVLPTLDAEGAGAVIEDMEATTPTVQYIAQDGAEVVLAGAVSAGTVLTFDDGTFALAAPGATIAAKLADIGTGDVLELPGTSVSAVTFGAASLTVTTNAGTYDFTNVTYAQGSVASYSVRHDDSTGLQAISFTAPDVFTETQATGGQYLWSTAANWSDGVPVAGGAVVMAAEGVDDIAGLTLASLDLSSPSAGIDGDLSVEAGLTIAKLTIAAASRIDVISSGQPDTLTITSSIAAPQTPAVLPTFDAEGAGAVIDDMEATTPTVEYIAQDGAKVELAGAVGAGTVLTFDDGTFALAAPGAAVNAKLADVGTGDVLELPGTSVSAVTFGATSLAVTTTAGTYNFANVTYDQGSVVGYEASHDGATGLEAIGFTAPDVFSRTQAAQSGLYLWSNAANWSNGVPVAGSAVVMAATGVDDIAGLTIGALTIATSAELEILATAPATGSLTVTGTTTNDGLIDIDPSTATFDGPVTGAGVTDIAANSEAVFNASVPATETVDFLSPTAVLKIDDPSAFHAVLEGTGTTLVQCYARGTRIEAESGAIPVEALAVGDLLATVSGVARPIRWIGHRDVDCLRHPHPAAVWPIRIRADAFAPGCPARDLFLSPDHAVFVDGVLIPVKHLQNGTTITQMPIDAITYFHIELERHDVVLAEGLAAETFLDTGNRNAFANEGGVTQLHPDFHPRGNDVYLTWEAFGYAPITVYGCKVERVRARLQARAALLAAPRHKKPGVSVKRRHPARSAKAG